MVSRVVKMVVVGVMLMLMMMLMMMLGLSALTLKNILRMMAV